MDQADDADKAQGGRDWPSLAPARVVTDPPGVFRDLMAHHGQCRPVQHSRPGLLVLPAERLAGLTRGLRDSVDPSTRSRLRSAAPWREEAVQRRRLRFMLQ